MKNILDYCKDCIFNPELKNYVTIGVGGNCDVICFPNCNRQLLRIIKYCKKNNKKYFILGNGSNVIPLDNRYKGIVISTLKLNKIKVKSDSVICGAGAQLLKVNIACMENGLSGLEWSYGIPGTIGGAIIMNAGAFNGEMKSVIKSVTIIDNNKIKKLTAKKINFEYRNSSIKQNQQIVIECELKLNHGEKKDIENLCRDYYIKRKLSQPMDKRNCGSILKNTNNVIAGKIIDKLGYKGVRIGGAEISKIHANFIVNTGNAKSKDIIDLIYFMREKIKEQTGEILDAEVIILGET